MNLLNILAQQPINQSKTSTSINPIALIIGLVVLFIVIIIIAVKFSSKNAKNDINDTTINDNNTKKNNEVKNEKSFPHGIILLIVIVATLIIIPFVAVKCSSDTSSSDTPTLITRNITKSDYTYTTSQDLTSYSITIVPELDFKSCTIELTLYNSKNKEIFSDTLTKSNLRKDSSYTYTFDFGFINALSGNSVSFNITGKCSTFQ